MEARGALDVEGGRSTPSTTHWLPDHQHTEPIPPYPGRPVRYACDVRLISSICKWALTVLLTLVLSLEIASVWYCFSWVKRHESGVPDGDWYTMVILDRGAVSVQKKGEGLVARFGFYPPQPLGLALKREARGSIRTQFAIARPTSGG